MQMEPARRSSKS